MALSDKFRLLSPLYEEVDISGSLFRFYPCSVGAAARMAEAISEMASHFSVLLGPKERDYGHQVEDFEDKKAGQVVSKTVVDPIRPEMAQLRSAERSRAVQGAINTLMGPKHRLALAELLADSLRDDFPRDKPRSADELQKWVEGMDVSILMQFVIGLSKANAKVFGDLGNLVGQAVRDQVGGLLNKAKATTETMGG